MSGIFLVGSFLPFWRYAVCPADNRNAGIPFHRIADARAFFDEVKAALPWTSAFIVHRRLFGRTVRVIEAYHPNPVQI